MSLLETWQKPCAVFLLRNAQSMSALSRFKGGRLVHLAVLPHGEEDARPNVGQSPNGYGMALAFSSFALVVFPSPGFPSPTAISKLEKRVAPGLDATQTAMGLLVSSALVEDWRGSCEGLPTARAQVAISVVARFSQQTRSEACSSSRQRQEYLAVGMAQKKALDLLIIVLNLGEQRLQLSYQGQHQPRFRASEYLGSLQTRLVEQADQFFGFLSRPRISVVLEQGGQILDRGRACSLEGGIGAQKSQGGGLLEFSKQIQGKRVIRFKTGGELIHQAGSHLDQRILVAGEGFQFLDQLTVRLESAQILEIGASGFGQQIGINGVGLGSGWGAVPVHCSGVHRIDRPSLLQQMRNQQSMGRFDDTGHLILSLWGCDAAQIGIQLVQPFRGMGNTDRSQLTALVINAQRIMIG